MADVRFLDEAEADYRDALAWYGRRNARAADGFEAAAEAAVVLIAANPLIGSPVGPRHRFVTLRRYPYSLIYRPDGPDLLVIAVAHSKRSAAFWRGRD